MSSRLWGCKQCGLATWMAYEAMHRCENCDAYEWESPAGEPGSKPTTIVGHMNGAIKDLAERVAKLGAATPARAIAEPGKVEPQPETVPIDVACPCGRTVHLTMPAGEFSVQISEAVNPLNPAPDPVLLADSREAVDRAIRAEAAEDQAKVVILGLERQVDGLRKMLNETNRLHEQVRMRVKRYVEKHPEAFRALSGGEVGQ